MISEAIQASSNTYR